MIILTWFATLMLAQGPVTGAISETTRFRTAEECRAFGEHMTPRLQDWVRGMVRGDWDLDVQVRFRCEPERSVL